MAKGRAEFEPFFVDPKQGPDSLAAASDLGFSGESSPDGWWDGFKSGDIDLAIHMAFESEFAEERSTSIGLEHMRQNRIWRNYGLGRFRTRRLRLSPSRGAAAFRVYRWNYLAEY